MAKLVRDKTDGEFTISGDSVTVANLFDEHLSVLLAGWDLEKAHSVRTDSMSAVKAVNDVSAFDRNLKVKATVYTGKKRGFTVEVV